MLGGPSFKNLTSPDFGTPPKEQNVLLQQLGYPQVASFNYMLSTGLDLAIKDLRPLDIVANGVKVKVSIGKAKIFAPSVSQNSMNVTVKSVYPNACRQARSTYKGPMLVSLDWSVNGAAQEPLEVNMGEVPIMLKSNRCHLNMMNPKQLIESGEHEQEWGGYFVTKGLEKLIRMMSLMRRNYPIGINRSSFTKRGPLFSSLGVVIRSTKLDQSAVLNILHFLTDGTCKMMFRENNKNMYHVPLILLLKCITDANDKYIFTRLMEGYEDNSYYAECVQNMMRLLHEEGLHSQDDCKNYMGQLFRLKLRQMPAHWTDHQITDYIMNDMVLVHLDNMDDKFNMIVFMTQKLYYVQSTNLVENEDHLMLQEVLLGGHLYNIILKESLRTYMVNMGFMLKQLLAKDSSNVMTREILRKASYPKGFAAGVEMIILTGNLSINNHSAVGQNVGLSVTVENINRIRYMSHFRAVHRGASFMKMRSTQVRQLTPDAWGFYCPVHTPDGAPCGLLNHLTTNCTITDMPDRKLVANIARTLAELGMVPMKQSNVIEKKDYFVTQLDGRILGYVKKADSSEFEKKLRFLKIKGDKVPNTLEICMVPDKKRAPQFPGIFLFSGPARMMRPLLNLATSNIEMVGTFEQNYLDVSIIPSEIYAGVTTHMELSKTDFLSHTAKLIPMPDCNQSPRNMYQCQMAKQTMGTPCHNFDLQIDKIYRLQTPASPIFRTTHYDDMDIDSFPMGTNAIVAVISYTGYDMEDAMIINKASIERGFANGTVYKTENIELAAECHLQRPPDQLEEFIDADGLPYVGRRVNNQEPLYSYYDNNKSKYVVNKFSGGSDKIYVHKVRIVPGMKMARMVRITYRIERAPMIGDKFASRAGQKGICSRQYPVEDLPFTESGIFPDIIFNPHGFPSRMTIAMMIELMAGKSGAIHGLVHDATPFKFNEEETAIDYFGRLLEAGGYNYYGTESMYSGIDGREMKAQIFFGVVHYQRLRHMVSDKWQVRSTGIEDAVTRQPIQGKKRGGGIRFGEMERDALISHGTSYMLQDRLMNSSDKSKVSICTKCKNMLSVFHPATDNASGPPKLVCAFCQTSDNISSVELPYVFKLLAIQLGSCNINLQLDCKEACT